MGVDLDHLDARTAAAVDARIKTAIATEREAWRAIIAVLIRTMRLEEEKHIEAARQRLDGEVFTLTQMLGQLRGAIADLTSKNSDAIDVPIRTSRELN